MKAQQIWHIQIGCFPGSHMMIANMRLLSLWLYNVYHYNLVLDTHIENDQCWSKRCVQQEADVIENQTLLLVFQMCSVATLS